MITKPTVVTMCGSSRWPGLHMVAQADEAFEGRIVIPLSAYGHADLPPGVKDRTDDGNEAHPGKQGLDELHLRKIDLADEILVVRVDGYVGSSTQREISYAEGRGRRVRWLDRTQAEAEEANAAIHCTHPKETP